MHTCCKIGFKHFNNSNDIFGPNLVGARFNIYNAIFSALIDKDLNGL